MGENKDYITHPDEKGSINISEEVISVIAASAVMETEGVAAISPGKELLGKKNPGRGVRITIDGESVKVDIWLTVKLGFSVNKVGQKVQEAVASSIESATGFAVTEVNVHVVGVYLGKK